MESWDDWSDEDLANQILVVMHGEVINLFTLSDCKTYVYDCGVIGESFYRVDLIDINKPADMWPIIVNSRITIAPYQDESQGWFATTDTSFFVDNENPLRAAAIVFLMMNGVTPNENQN